MITISIITLLIFIWLGKSEDYQYLSRSTSAILKAILPLFILLHHICLNYGILSDFRYVGYYVVGLFFFISGFGLEYKRKEGQIELSKFHKRIHKLLKPIFIPILIYIPTKMILEDQRIAEVLRQSIGWKIILPYTWFVVTLIILTIAFYATCQFKSTTKHLIGLLVFTLLFSVLCKSLGVQSTYHTSNIAFVMGAFACNMKCRIESMMRIVTKYIALIMIGIALCLEYNSIPYSTYLCVPFWAFGTVAIVSLLPPQGWKF